MIKFLIRLIISIINKYQPNTVDNYRSLLRTFSKAVVKPFDKINREAVKITVKFTCVTVVDGDST
jgi:hypothetical protein